MKSSSEGRVEFSLLGKENTYSPVLNETWTHLLASVQAWSPWWDWKKARILSPTGELSGLNGHWGSPCAITGLWPLGSSGPLRLPPAQVTHSIPRVPYSLMKANASLPSDQLISLVIFPLSHNSFIVCLEFQVVLCLQIPSPLRDHEHTVSSFSLFRQTFKKTVKTYGRVPTLQGRVQRISPD